MFTKDKWLKIVIFVLVVGIAATLIIFLLPRKQEIVVSAENVETHVDEIFEIKYEVSDPMAVVECVAKDENIIEKVAGYVNRFKAKEVGQAEVEVVAYTATDRKSCTCLVIVLPKLTDPSSPTEPDESNENPTNPNEQTDPTQPNVENKFSIMGLEGNVLEIGDKPKMVTLIFDEGVDMTKKISFVLDDGITIQRMGEASSVYLITAHNSGYIKIYNGETCLGKIQIQKITTKGESN